MDMQLQLVASTLLLPMFLSSLLKLMMVRKRVKNIDYITPGIFLVWLGGCPRMAHSAIELTKLEKTQSLKNETDQSLFFKSLISSPS